MLHISINQKPKKKKFPKFEFSKVILLIETLLTLYVTYETISFIKMSITSGYAGTLPYLTTLIGVVWGAYGTSIGFYYKKAERENVIKLSPSNPISVLNTDRTTDEQSTIVQPVNKKIDC